MKKEQFVNCKNISFTDITLRKGASWYSHLVGCDFVVAQNVTIDSHVNINNDGFDLDECKNVKMTTRATDKRKMIFVDDVEEFTNS